VPVAVVGQLSIKRLVQVVQVAAVRVGNGLVVAQPLERQIQALVVVVTINQLAVQVVQE
jgi:hypothetical protein